MRRFCLWLFGVSLSFSVLAQDKLPVSPAMERAYERGTRSKDGAPGAKYWQNSANYDINVDFDPASRLLKGEVSITYFNHSPDTLREVWLKLYPNLYQKSAPRKAKINLRDLGAGVQISAFKVGGKLLKKGSWKEDGTNMQATIPALLPGDSLRLSITYSYTLNKGSHVRTGQVDEGSAFIAYFYPRLAVYDDVDGWNKLPYSGDEEFYHDFGNYKVALTLPKKYLVWATGDLVNQREVYQSAILERIKKAETSDAIIDILSAEDLKGQQLTKGVEHNTWRFEAAGVPDFAWATSDHYVWKSASVVVDSTTMRRTRVDAVFNPVHKDFEEVASFTRQTVHAMSHVFPKWPFPYSHETVFDGLDQMEYPMMVNDNPVSSREDAITLTIHEVFHTLFPFYMGTHETNYAWMDEGWATLGEWLLSPLIDSNMVDTYGVQQTAMTSGTKNDTPVVTPTTELKGSGVFTNSYPKAAMGYLFMKDYLGDERFLQALHHYINLWKGKHPRPEDFFNSMNAGVGEDLDWFWNRWFFSEGVTDLGIASVKTTDGGYIVQIRNQSVKPLPVDLELEFKDGTKEKVHRSVGIWKDGGSVVDILVPGTKPLKKVTLGGVHTPDKFSGNNSYFVR